MEGDSKKTKKTKRTFFNVGNVLPTFWIRLPFQVDNGGEWIILGGRRYLLLYFRVFLAVLYVAFQTAKQI